MQRETGGIQRQLRYETTVCTETKCNRIFLKYMKPILMKSPNNEGDRAPIGRPLLPKEA